MISEKKFALGFASFWNDAMPMGERFVRQQNLQLQRFTRPLWPDVPSRLRGVTNELGFQLFCKSRELGNMPLELPETVVSQLAEQSARFIRRFREYSRKEVAEATPEARREACELAERLAFFFGEHEPQVPIVCKPAFPGCGRIDPCEGDALAGETLYEVKAGDRAFRTVDLRQVLCYCALNHAARRYSISRVGLVNPRVGVFFVHPLDWLCREVSGVASTELFAEILDFASQPENSR